MSQEPLPSIPPNDTTSPQSQQSSDPAQTQTDPIAADTQDAMQDSSNSLIPETQDQDQDQDQEQDEDIDIPDAENIEGNPEVDGADGDVAREGTVPDIGLDGAADAPDAPQTERPEPRIPVKKDVTLREFLGKMDDYAPIIPDAVTAYYLTLAGLPPPPTTSPHLCRLLALAAQKFIADVAADAYQYARIRTGHTTSNTAAANAAAGVGVGVPGVDGVGVAGPGGAGGAGKGKEDKGKAVQLGVQRPGFGGGGQGGMGQGRTVLTMEDLGMAVGEYGVNVKRGEFYR